MPRDIWGDVLDAQAAQGIRSIPRMCSCTWEPRFSTVPATWTRTGADPSCKLHRTGENGAGE